MTASWIAFIPFLLSLGFIVFAIYFATTALKFMRKNNEYLKEISEVIKKNNRYIN